MKKYLSSLKLSNTLGGGVNRTNKKLVILVLVIFELSLITLAYISYNNKNLDKYIFGSTSIKNNSLFAIMLEDSGGTYKQTDLEEFPGYEYFYNNTKSGCMSSKGSIIPDSLLYDQDNKKATVKVSSSSKCYLYFDKYKETSLSYELIDSGVLWQSGLEGDGYRYVGSGSVGESTNPNNFFCFGTTDVADCTSNQDKYMYRIIGVFPDESGNQHVKLIKYKQLGSYKWNSNEYNDTSWENSDLYKGLNGSGFLTNTTYDYLQNNTWLNKIENWTWSAVNTKTYEDQTNNPYYYYSTTKGIYLNEMHKTSSETLCKNVEETAINCNGGEWTTPTGKIGLMYASDYALSLGSSALALTGSTDYSTLKTGWMHQSNNDTTKSTWEWTLSRGGDGGGNFYAWYVGSGGYVHGAYVDFSGGARPVLYLTSNEKLNTGTGSLDDPFILETNSSTSNLKVTLTKDSNILKGTITKGSGNLTKYCINNSVSINDCTWKSISGTTITYAMTNEGIYYVHVIDDQGFIAHSSLKYELYKFDSNKSLAQNLIDSEWLWQSGLEGDGYRYVGSGEVGTENNPNNFICFGTTSKTDCTANQDNYMYRIIGVFSDANGNNHVKLIKYKQLKKIYWHSAYNVNKDWSTSMLFSNLNGGGFLTNVTYVPDTEWTNKIEDWTWSAVNTKTNDGSSGPDYYNTFSPKQIYLHEMNTSAKTSTVGSWSTPSGKIGLMYVSDYLMSIGRSAIGTISGVYKYKSTYLTGWMHQSNNDTAKSQHEWTTARVGAGSSGKSYFAWAIRSDGSVDDYLTSGEYGVRPVFYLTSDVGYSSGTGTLDDPYILK